MRVEVAIIGTGPAGGAAASFLAETGLSVVVLERDELPRPKACGGLIPEASLGNMPQDLHGLIAWHVEKRKYSYQYDYSHCTSTPESVLALVDRAEFDAGIIQRALAASRGSISLRQNFHVRHVEENEGGVVIHSDNGERVMADFLIAADGAASRTARCLGLNPQRQNAVGIDTDVRVSKKCFSQFSSTVIFDYYCLPKGYGWIFPKANGVLSVGVASWGKGVNCKKAMSAYLAHTIAEGELCSALTRAHPIPVYAGQVPIASSRVCLVGDAASLVDPVTGEGIRFALKSGGMAAEVICGLQSGAYGLGKSADGCRLYQERVLATIGKHLDALHKFAVLPFLQAPQYYYHRFITNTEVPCAPSYFEPELR